MTELAVRSAALAQLSQARQLLEASRDLAEVKQIRDLALAAEEYARAAKLGAESERYARQIANEAERRFGQLLKATEPEVAGRPKIGSEPKPISPRQEAGKAFSARSQALARMDDAEFEAANNGITSADRIARQQRRGERMERIRSNGTPPELAAITRCPVLYADPPWRYEQSESPDRRKVENYYPTMTIDAIKALDVPALDDAVLFLWATSPKLTEALDVMHAWRFTYRTCMVWVKDRIGMGYYARQRHEFLLIGRRGDMPPPLPSSRPDSVIEAPRGEHSAKPQIFYDLIERMYPGLAYCELFQRSPRNGWHGWGNEANA